MKGQPLKGGNNNTSTLMYV